MSSTIVTLRAERVVDRRHLEPDDAAADDQQPLRDAVELERAGRVDHPRVVVGMNGSFTGSEPAAMMRWSKVTVFAAVLRPRRRIAFGPVNVPRR